MEHSCYLWQGSQLYDKANRSNRCSGCSFSRIDTDKASYYASFCSLIRDHRTKSNGCKTSLMKLKELRPSIMRVDVTNYTLLYFGQPMAAFDLIPLKEAISRAWSACWWEIATFDEERELKQLDLVITVADKPVALCRGCHGLAVSKVKVQVVSSLKPLFNGKIDSKI